MARRFPIQTFIDDLILGNRRLAERSDISLVLDWAGDFDELPPLYSVKAYGTTTLKQSGAGSYGVRLEKPGSGYVNLSANRPLEQEEFVAVELLAGVLAYCLSKDRLLLSGHIGETLKEARESLNLSQAELAAHADTTRFAVWKWESGAQAPSVAAMYRWCQALGLVCPPKTALVRVVDFSPDLLRFLQEDPTRLRSLTPNEFERFTAERLDRMGYNVTLTGTTNRKDGGIDLIAVPKLASLGSYVIAGQVKHHRADQSTGVEAVDRLLAWKDSVFRAGLLVTNTKFTNDAVWKAQKDGNAHFLRLRDFNDLKRWLQDQYGTEEDWREIPERMELAPGVVVEIPRPRITTALPD